MDPPKIPIFWKNRPTILIISVCAPRCLLEASKKLPRAAQELPKSPQEPSKGPQDAPKSLQEAPTQPPRGFRQGGLLDVYATAFGTYFGLRQSTPINFIV